MKYFKNKKRGIGSLEVLIGISIIFVSIFSTISSYHFFLKITQKNTKTIKTQYLLEEGAEAIRIIRDSDWTSFSNINVDTDKYLFFDGNTWVLADNNIYIDNFFERKIIIKNVYRDSDDKIAEAGTLDLGTRRADIYVSWFGASGTTTDSISIYLTNLSDD